MHNAVFRFLPFLLSMVLFAAHDGASGLPKADTLKPVATPKECKARGGEWIWYQMGQFHFCLIKTGDAGKPCSDDGQCQGDCVPTERQSKHPGVCARTLPMPGGCHKHLVAGKLIEEPCI